MFSAQLPGGHTLPGVQTEALPAPLDAGIDLANTMPRVGIHCWPPLPLLPGDSRAAEAAPPPPPQGDVAFLPAIAAGGMLYSGLQPELCAGQGITRLPPNFDGDARDVDPRALFDNNNRTCSPILEVTASTKD